jgi:uncharacterized sulfatase
MLLASSLMARGLFAAEPARAAGRPNIIVFFSDQQRWDSAGCYGQKLPTTPNLDRMAREGVRFEFAFTCQPVCGPARASVQTGRYAAETGCFRNGIGLPPGEKTIAHWLSEQGYEVGYLGKWHLASNAGGKTKLEFRDAPVPPEFRGGYRDFWLASDVLEFTSHAYDGHMYGGDMQRVDFPPGRYRADAVTDFGLDYLRKRDRARPLFLFISYIEPHHQNDHKHFEGPRGSRERWKDFEVPGDLVGTEGDWRQEFPDYLGCVHALDQNLGRLRAELEKLAMADNTLILYTSDHACHFRTRNSEYKRACQDNAIRIPLVACGPGFRGGRVVKDLVSLIDVPPTILAAGGAKIPETMRGRPLQPLVDGTAKDWPKEVFIQISESQVGRAIRTSKWKYSVRAPGGKGARGAGSDRYVEDFLYDLENDPHERNNLVRDPQYAGVRRELAATLKRRMVAAGERQPRIDPAPVDSEPATR